SILRHIRGGSALQRPDGILLLGVETEYDNRQRRAKRFQFLEYIETVRIGKTDIENHEIPRRLLGFRQRFLTGPYLGDLKLRKCIGQHLFESDSDDRMIVDEKNFQHCAWRHR